MRKLDWHELEGSEAIPYLEAALAKKEELTLLELEEILHELGGSDFVHEAYFAALDTIVDLIEATSNRRELLGMISRYALFAFQTNCPDEYVAEFRSSQRRLLKMFTNELENCVSVSTCSDIRSMLIGICACSGDETAARAVWNADA